MDEAVDLPGDAAPQPAPVGAGSRSGAMSGAMSGAASALDLIEQATALVSSGLDGVTFGLLDDTEAVAVMSALEGLGRRVDAARVASTADVGERSRGGLGHDSLAWKSGCRNALDLITRVTLVSGREVNRRMRLGGFVADRVSDATALPPLYPAVAAGLAAGELGVESAEIIVTALAQIAHRCAPDDLLTAERALVASATGAITEENEGLPGTGFAFAADLMRGVAQQWQARLDPDGAAPNDSVSEPRSNIGFGQLTKGLFPLRGGVTPELRGVITAVFDTYLSAHAAPAFPTVEEQARIDAGELIPGAECPADDRNGGEKRADVLRGVFEAAARDPKTPRMGGAAPTVMVHVNAVDLLDDKGVGWVDGVEAPVSMRTVRQLVCTGGYQKIMFAESGEVLYLGGKERFFTSEQRRAIAARDGGCVIPGCIIPARWCEVHHVIPWQYNGKTNIDNGVLLCWYHHHSIETSGWEIRMMGGKPQVKAPPWIDPSRTWRAAAAHRASRLEPTRSRRT
jgi:hypothetical protein